MRLARSQIGMYLRITTTPIVGLDEGDPSVGREQRIRQLLPGQCLGHNPVMPEYRRNRIPGGTYFFTVNLLDRKQQLLVEHVDALRDAVRTIRARRPFHIDAWVVLPEHMHAVWTMPSGDSDYSGRWHAIKALFTKTVRRGDPAFALRGGKGECGIWQRRFWEHTIRDDVDFRAHLDYVHINPVKHGLVECVLDWPYSSFHRYLARGVYAPDWVGGRESDLAAGERRE